MPEQITTVATIHNAPYGIAIAVEVTAEDEAVEITTYELATAIAAAVDAFIAKKTSGDSSNDSSSDSGTPDTSGEGFGQ